MAPLMSQSTPPCPYAHHSGGPSREWAGLLGLPTSFAEQSDLTASARASLRSLGTRLGAVYCLCHLGSVESLSQEGSGRQRRPQVKAASPKPQPDHLKDLGAQPELTSHQALLTLSLALASRPSVVSARGS